MGDPSGVEHHGQDFLDRAVKNDRGEMVNPTFLDYRMPTILDLPMIDTVIVEVACPSHPFGVRGVGEVPIVPPPAAIARGPSGAG